MSDPENRFSNIFYNLKLLENTLDGIGEITIVGQDLLGNTATRIVTSRDEFDRW